MFFFGGVEGCKSFVVRVAKVKLISQDFFFFGNKRAFSSDVGKIKTWCVHTCFQLALME